MLIEQAFQCLPEVLLGRPYARQAYEGGLLSAFSMALLQEFNGRNVPNPIASLHAECPYSTVPFVGSDGKARYRRVDLHVDLASVGASSDPLSRYGWRHSNWIEAKFFRPPRTGAAPKTTNAGLLYADLLRLITLVPLVPPGGAAPGTPNLNGTIETPKTFMGRYLLHVYEGNHVALITSTRNQTAGGAAGTRVWLDKLLLTGRQSLSHADCSIADEGGAFMKAVGSDLRQVQIEVCVSTAVLDPIDPGTLSGSMFRCVLNRIDTFRVEIDSGEWVALDANRTITESATGAAAAVAAFVGERAGVTGADDQDPDPLHVADPMHGAVLPEVQ